MEDATENISLKLDALDEQLKKLRKRELDWVKAKNEHWKKKYGLQSRKTSPPASTTASTSGLALLTAALVPPTVQYISKRPAPRLELGGISFVSGTRGVTTSGMSAKKVESLCLPSAPTPSGTIKEQPWLKRRPPMHVQRIPNGTKSFNPGVAANTGRTRGTKQSKPDASPQTCDTKQPNHDTLRTPIHPGDVLAAWPDALAKTAQRFDTRRKKARASIAAAAPGAVLSRIREIEARERKRRASLA
ncbi:hypothetical protein EJ06DRAFT_534782 [Trichodelitschia bisporula]|uniref:Uncharacterized protein n=1 Tax=Trichodelitschia bisporula TaxID=703511 RepID=A0A6G1HIF8_9PEZI|nr:hypothetical protein EJ06DRAFT_534782 [Trichodelitschia bisporula]